MARCLQCVAESASSCIHISAFVQQELDLVQVAAAARARCLERVAVFSTRYVHVRVSFKQKMKKFLGIIRSHVHRRLVERCPMDAAAPPVYISTGLEKVQ
jgi:hypothetical protein